MSNLIYVVYDRGFRLATYDFREAIDSAFSDSYLVVYDIINKRTLLDFYCDESNLYELYGELRDKDLLNLIPECGITYGELKKKYEDIWKKRDEHNRKMQEDHEYEIYLKVKERLSLD